MTKNSNCSKHGKQIKGNESTDTFQSLAVMEMSRGDKTQIQRQAGRRQKVLKHCWWEGEGQLKETSPYNYPFIHCLQTHKQEKAVYKGN